MVDVYSVGDVVTIDYGHFDGKKGIIVKVIRVGEEEVQVGYFIRTKNCRGEDEVVLLYGGDFHLINEEEY